MLTSLNAWLMVGGFLLLLSGAVLLFLNLLIWLLVRKAEPVWSFLRSVSRSMKEGAADNPDMKRLVSAHPVFFGFIKRRLNREVFSGLPATLLGLAFCYVFFLYLGSVEDFLTADPIVIADARIANLLYSFRNPLLTRMMLWVTLLGKWQVCAGATLSISAILLFRGPMAHAIGLWVSVLGSVLFSQLGKMAFHRPRPPVAEYIESTWSFPSGHATISTALYGFIIFLIWRFGRNWKTGILTSSFLTFVILSIGFSRLYLGVHYLSDVWSGYLVGLLWLIIGLSVAEVLGSRPKTSGSGAVFLQRYARTISTGIGVLLAIFYLVTGLNYDPPKNVVPSTPGVVVTGDILKAFADKNLSPATETITGGPQEPMSFIILARDEEQLIETFSGAKWFLAASDSLPALVTAARSALYNLQDTVAPMTPSFWEGRPHDYGFQKPLPDTGLRKRHHARFWKTPFTDASGRKYFVGTASLDNGMKWLITHIISPDLDTEREFLFHDLVSTGEVKVIGKEVLVGPSLGKNFAGDPFFTDGMIYILDLAE